MNVVIKRQTLEDLDGDDEGSNGNRIVHEQDGLQTWITRSTVCVSDSLCWIGRGRRGSPARTAR